MNLKEEGVCNWKLAKRLCELGDKQESLWWWAKVDKDSDWKLVSSEELNSIIDIETTLNTRKRIKYYPAPTVAELGERLKGYSLPTFQEDNLSTDGWRARFGTYCIFTGEKTESNARAKLRIYLLENKRG